jgi:hypothetical protein
MGFTRAFPNWANEGKLTSGEASSFVEEVSLRCPPN